MRKKYVCAVNFGVFMDKLIIVPTEESHLDKIAEIESICFSSPWSRKSFADGMANCDIQSYFTAIFDGVIVGYICLFHIFEDGELLNIAVSPEYRKMGIAQSLIDRMVEYLKQKNVNRITLEVRKSNVAAKSLYEKNGFKQFAVRKNYYTDPFEDGIIMEKHI